MSNTEDEEQLITLYTVSVKDLAFFKRQQWTISYYCILIFSTLVGLSSLTNVPIWVPYLSTILVLINGILLISELQESIDLRRARLNIIRPQLSKSFQEAWDAGKKKGNSSVFVILVLTLLVGALVSVAWIEETKSLHGSTLKFESSSVHEMKRQRGI